ncbi:MAG: phosphoribosylglycinamide formyltransferase [Cytophagales bacterium]|nr:phosphoribosylglycinamide formyltransferase [Bernardetiaceae bacterium]MDW8205259.1 phosphoribosylglycinamide formyltransferase [Cytophagales bacterium]
MPNVALFASGSGTNVENIIKTFQHVPEVRFKVFCNKPNAGVLARAASLQVPTVLFNRADLYESDAVLQQLIRGQVDLIVLAGFLWLMPASIVGQFPHQIINIHPALLPKFGGKGMYGEKVHQAVIAAGETVSGITIHYVNENYDEGQIIRQVQCPVYPSDTPQSLAARIHALEYEHYPQVIGELLGLVPTQHKQN